MICIPSMALAPVGVNLLFKKLDEQRIFLITYLLASVYCAAIQVSALVWLAPPACILAGHALATLATPAPNRSSHLHPAEPAALVHWIRSAPGLAVVSVRWRWVGRAGRQEGYCHTLAVEIDLGAGQAGAGETAQSQVWRQLGTGPASSCITERGTIIKLSRIHQQLSLTDCV